MGQGNGKVVSFHFISIYNQRNAEPMLRQKFNRLPLPFPPPPHLFVSRWFKTTCKITSAASKYSKRTVSHFLEGKEGIRLKCDISSYNMDL